MTHHLELAPTHVAPERFRPTPMEIASGLVLGQDPEAPSLPEVPAKLDPREALHDSIVPALERAPCIVSFSGGRDSSAVLALATLVARREGLPLPIPITFVFPGVPESIEDAWQQKVVRHLGLDDWIKVELDDEMDFLGLVSTGVLRRHGLLWPPNTFFNDLTLTYCEGGSMLTGIDGDSLFGAWRWGRVSDVLAGRTRPKARDALRMAHALAPRSYREGRAIKRFKMNLPWLRPDVQEELSESFARDIASEPVRWDERVKWWARRRHIGSVVWSLDLLAKDRDAMVVHPLADRRFLAALAESGGRLGYGTRTSLMAALFADVLPKDVVRRGDKALLTMAFFGNHTRDFANRWNGRGLDENLVDREMLREIWLSERPDGRTSLLLQQAWLGSQPRDLRQRLNHAV